MRVKAIVYMNSTTKTKDLIGIFLSMIFLLGFLAACVAPVNPQATQTTTKILEATSTNTKMPPSPTPSKTPEPTPEPSPEPSPTPRSVVYEGSKRVTTANLDQISLIAGMGDGHVSELEWSPTNDYLAVCTMLGVDIFRLKPFEIIKELNPNLSCETLSWSPDGTVLAVAVPGGQIQFWNTDTWQDPGTFQSSFSGIFDLAWSSDGGRIAVGATNGTASLFDVADMIPEDEIIITPHVFGGVLVAWSPDGSQISTANLDGRMMLWDTKDGSFELLLDGHDAPITGLAWSNNGKTLVSSSEDGIIKFWDVTEGIATDTWNGNAPIALSADGKSLFFNHENQISVQAIKPDSQSKPLGSSSLNVLALELSKDGKSLAAIDQHGALLILDSKTGRGKESYTHYSLAITDLIASPDGKQYGSLSADGTVVLYQADNGEELLRLEGTAVFANQLSWSPDGELIAFEGQAGTVRIYDINTKDFIANLKTPLPSMVSGLDWSPDSQTLAVGHTNAEITIWHRENWRMIETLDAHADAVGAVDWSPDGKFLAAGDDLGILRVWDPWNNQSLGRIEGHAAAIFDLSYSPDGSVIATASADGYIFLWDANQYTLIRKLDAQGCQLNRVSWNRDGSLLSSVDSCGQLSLWNPQQEIALLSLKENDNPLYGLLWAANDKSLLTAGLDGILRVWGIQ